MKNAQLGPLFTSEFSTTMASASESSGRGFCHIYALFHGQRVHARQAQISTENEESQR